ncbi:MAG: protocatechuate 3,4-dioxygenase [Oligoflexia bacterium]|nr:protocatechuate 3,4-dioxygenase [Oligoflexia bacterium]
MKIVNRRNFLKIGAGFTGSLALSSFAAKSFAATCSGVLTPTQTRGPFYPGEKNFTGDQDLTFIEGSSRRALGKVIYVTGTVADKNCQPISGANVEIWQACASGRYNHNADPNEAPLDPNFQYWAEAETAEDGSFLFKTIVPGAYPADIDWTRPPHIHFKVSKLGYKELITQMYFSGDSLNDRDLILQSLAKDERDSVIVDLVPSPESLEPNTKIGHFSILLDKVRS